MMVESLFLPNFRILGRLSGRDYDSGEASSILPVWFMFRCEVGAAVSMGVVVSVGWLVVDKF